MERNNSITPPGIGRGRPVPQNDLRRPFTCPTYAQQDFVSNEGSSNGISNSGIGCSDTQDVRIGLDSKVDEERQTNAIENDVNMGAPEKKFQLSPFAPEFVPRNFRPESKMLSLIPPINTVNSIADPYPIQELRQFLYDITLNPGKFESKIQRLVDCLNDYVNESETMRAVVNTIFDESVRQPNFRYNGARLSKHLCDELNEYPEESSFRSLLFERCLQELKRREHLMKSEDGGVYLRGFAMYLAELFSQIEVSKRKLNISVEHLTSVVETLLSHPSLENVKCVCQLLKLAGAYVEDSERKKITNNGAAPETEKIFNLLKELLKLEELSTDIHLMVENIVELRYTDWGRANENNDPVIGDHVPPSLDEPVMYGPDGQPITAEESLFLHSQYSSNVIEPEEYDSYDDAIFDNEMEEEMAAAYEDFLNDLSQQQQQQQQQQQ